MRFDFEETFGPDYLHFFSAQLTEERNDRDASDVTAFLDLAPGSSVLDAPCGHGRISNRLSRAGLRVVGVDASDQFLEIARAEGEDVDFRRGDMRALPVDGPFDAVVSWFTSFGYFDDDGNKQTLREYRRVLRPGGQLLIEMHNRDEIVRRFTPAPFSLTTQVGDDIRVETFEFDCVEGRMETDWLVVRDGMVRRSHHSIRIPAITELRAWLREAGFSNTKFMARDGEEPSVFRPRLIVLATAG